MFSPANCFRHDRRARCVIATPLSARGSPRNSATRGRLLTVPSVIDFAGQLALPGPNFPLRRRYGTLRAASESVYTGRAGGETSALLERLEKPPRSREIVCARREGVARLSDRDGGLSNSPCLRDGAVFTSAATSGPESDRPNADADGYRTNHR